MGERREGEWRRGGGVGAGEEKEGEGKERGEVTGVILCAN